MWRAALPRHHSRAKTRNVNICRLALIRLHHYRVRRGASNGAAAPKRATTEAAGELPARYQRLLIGQQTGVNGVWDYDFSVHNPTAFAGLENGIANCYTNPLWQVLNFVPELRCVASRGSRCLTVAVDPQRRLHCIIWTSVPSCPVIRNQLPTYDLTCSCEDHGLWRSCSIAL